MCASTVPPPGRRQLFGRLNQTYAYLNIVCNGNSCDLIELEAELDLDLLQRVVERVIDRHPMARSVYARRGPFLDWIHCASRLPVTIEVHRIESDDPATIRHKLLAAAWGPKVLSQHQHPFRFIYTRTPRGPYLQVITTHVYTDGKAANIFAADIAECYEALEAGREWTPAPADIADRSHDRMFLGELSWRRRAHLFLAGGRCLLSDVLSPAGRLAIDGPRTSETDVLMIELPDELSDSMRRAARRHNITMHPFLLVAVLRTCEAFNHAKGRPLRRPLRIVDNFSLRRFSRDPAIHRIYDCVAAPYTLAIDPGKNNDRLLDEIYRTLDSLKQGEILRELYRLRFYYWLSLPLPKNIAIWIACFLCTRADVICSNVGVLDARLQRIGSIGVRSYFSFPQLFPPGKVMYQISSFHGRMRLALLYDRGQLTEGEARQYFVDAFLRTLGELVSIPQAEPAGPAISFA
jgi:hypothetical protein